MLQFKQSDIEITLIVTLTELVSINEPFYIFQFTHVLTKETVDLIKSYSDDESNYQDRYNQFTINPSVLFSGKPAGEWHYIVFESEDGISKGGILEYGKMMLDKEIEFEFLMYNEPTGFKAYNG